jgi:hypothetical protein
VSGRLSSSAPYPEEHSELPPSSIGDTAGSTVASSTCRAMPCMVPAATVLCTFAFAHGAAAFAGALSYMHSCTETPWSAERLPQRMCSGSREQAVDARLARRMRPGAVVAEACACACKRTCDSGTAVRGAERNAGLRVRRWLAPSVCGHSSCSRQLLHAFLQISM